MNWLNIQNAPLTILISIDGRMYLTAFEEEKYEALSSLLKMGISTIVPTDVTQSALNKLLRGESL